MKTKFLNKLKYFDYGLFIPFLILSLILFDGKDDAVFYPTVGLCDHGDQFDSIICAN